MKYLSILKTALCCLLFISQQSIANIIDFNQYFVDEETGFSWLKLSETAPYSIFEIRQELKNDESNPLSNAQGWRLANLNEVQMVFSHLGLPITYQEFKASELLRGDVFKASLLFGNTVNLSSDYYQNGFIGFVANTTQSEQFNTIGAWSLKDNFVGIESEPLSALYSADHNSPWIGTYLVKDGIAVSEPSYIFFLTLVFLLVKEKRKTRLKKQENCNECRNQNY